MLRLLRWLVSLNGFMVDNGGRHQWVLRHASWNRPFPVPFKHNAVSNIIVQALMKRVVETGICTKEEFDRHL
ncbi:MAG: hypothetical protein V1738_04955 [Patescibacteria group bacterium]